MNRWWHADDDAPQDGGDDAFLVVETKLVDPSRRECDVLQRCSVLVSSAMRDILARVAQHLTVARDVTDASKIASADLTCTVSSERAARITALLAQVKHDRRTGAVLPFSNAYRFTACTPIEGTDRFTAVARLARGEWRERRGRSADAPRVHALDCIPATTGLQQLLATYVATDIVQTVPSALRAGVCQEVAQ